MINKTTIQVMKDGDVLAQMECEYWEMKNINGVRTMFATDIKNVVKVNLVIDGNELSRTFENQHPVKGK